jgi:hypothetical protein
MSSDYYLSIVDEYGCERERVECEETTSQSGLLELNSKKLTGYFSPKRHSIWVMRDGWPLSLVRLDSPMYEHDRINVFIDRDQVRRSTWWERAKQLNGKAVA